MNKNRIRLTESQLHNVIKESVKQVINELGDTVAGQARLGALAQRKSQQAMKMGQQYGTFSQQSHDKWQSANKIKNYAAQKRQSAPQQQQHELSNGWERGGDAQHAMYTHGIDRQQRNNIINNGWGKTEEQLHRVIKESIKRVLNEMENDNVTYDAWSQYLGGKEPVFEFEDGLTYVDYDENNGVLCSGHLTNIGFHKDGEVEVPVEDGNFQAALEEVYSQLCCIHVPM